MTSELPTPIVSENGGAEDIAHRMIAMGRDVYGSAAVLRPTRVAVPVAGEHDVLLRVAAAGVDRGAWHLMTGRPYAVRLGTGLRRPRNKILGREVAGTVEAVGSGVTGFAAGDEVFGIGTGAFAEYALASPEKLTHKPATVSFAEAAATPVSGLTALQAVRDAGRVERGQSVLVLGASGGVGTLAVQIATGLGAEVTAVCRARKHDRVRSLGAVRVVDYPTADFADGVRRYDVILDLGGNPSISRLRGALTPSGTAVIVGGEQGGSWTGGLDRQLRAVALSPFVRQRLTTLLCSERAADLDHLARLMATGLLIPAIDDVYHLSDLPEAMRRLAAGHVTGKSVIAI